MFIYSIIIYNKNLRYEIKCPLYRCLRRELSPARDLGDDPETMQGGKTLMLLRNFSVHIGICHFRSKQINVIQHKDTIGDKERFV